MPVQLDSSLKKNSVPTLRVCSQAHTAESRLDRTPPRPMSPVATPDRMIGLCCDVPGSERWDLVHREFSEAMRDEIRERTEALAMECQLGANVR
jgi:hypothetical protein